MKIEREVLGEVGVLTITGKMLIGEGEEMLRDEIDRFLNEGVARVLLDFQDVPYVDSSGMYEIVRSYTKLARADGTVALVNLNQRISSLLRITKLLSVFPVFATKIDALVALRDGTWDNQVSIEES